MRNDSETLAKLAEDYWRSSLEFNPLMATMLGIDGFDERMADPSREGSRRQVEVLDGLWERLAAVDANGLDRVDRTTKAILEQRITDERDVAQAGLQEVAISSSVAGELSGILATVPQAALTTPERAEDYVKRLHAVGSYLDALSERYRQAKVDGRHPTALGVTQAIGQIDGYLATDLARDPFLRPTPQHAADPAGWQAKAEDAIKESVRPALARLRTIMEDELMPVGRDDDHVGVCHIPGGLTGYSSNVRLFTTTAMSPEEIHGAGAELLAELAHEITELGAATFGTTTVTETVARLQEERFSTSDEIMRLVTDSYHRAELALPGWFRAYDLPPCALKEMNELQAKGGIAAYYMWPSTDGSRPGTMWVNTYQPQDRALAAYEVLAFHEGVPGHHLQVVASANTDLPAFRQHRRIAAHSEGWGLYVERLADEMGLYSSPVFRLGMLSSAAWRAARLVVDTGIHHFGWSRLRAIRFMAGNTALSELEIRNEIDRYIAAPGQALSYFIGRVRIDALRAKAKAALGSAFDIAEFHHRLLADGSVPLDVLDRLIDEWIGEAASSARPGEHVPS